MNPRKLKGKNVRWIEIDIPVYLGDNPYKNLPMLFDDEESLIIKVDLATGIIRNWHYKEDVRLFFKVSDEGNYRFYDENHDLVEAFHGYVPNKLLPPPDGYDDYIRLHISREGKITNWYEHITLENFYEYI
ncbi:MAG: hypothetical protein LBG80_20640 [Bacteroidales bacterium]|jgi:hypothetical protein|nr:hypothetical protein [Bacteroidales bacterium]